MSTQIDSLQIEIESNSSKASSEIDKLSASLKGLKDNSNITKITNSLSRLSSALQGLNSSSKGLENISKLSSALSGLQSLGKVTNLTSALNQLKKIPEITASLKPELISQFSQRINSLTSALKPLATELNTISSSFSKLPNKITSCVSATNKMSNSSKILGAGFSGLAAKLGIYGLGVNQIINYLGDCVNKSNMYIENVNLFTVSMGKYAQQAMDYAQKVSDAFGIDISEWIRNQGIFMSLAKGFGLAEDKAYQMSKGLTEVSYDISSFFNISLNDADGALNKVQSGIAGELEPLRRLGYALDQASLQQVAHNHGINESIQNMTQAQKAVLRYTAIVEQSQRMGVIGDLSRTVITPANALRILNQEITQLKRALGDVFLPLLIKLIPYVQAFVLVLKDAAASLASFFGFKLPKIDYSSLNNGIDSTTASLDDATDSAKELKKQLMGFDEINMIPAPSTDKSSSTGNSLSSDLGIDLASVWDDSILSGITSQVDAIKPKIEKLLKVVEAIGIAFLSWKIASDIMSFFSNPTTGTGFLTTVKSIWKAFASPSGETIKLMSMFGDSAAYVGTAAVAVGIAATIAVMALRFVDLYKNSQMFQDGLSAIWNTLKSIGSKAKEGLSKLEKYIPNISSEWKDLLITLGGIGLLFTPAAPFGVALLAFEGITAAIRGIGVASEDAYKKVDVLGDGISKETKEKVQPFLDSMKKLDETIDNLDWSNKIIDSSDVSNVKSQLDSIVKTITTELDADKNEALKKLSPLKNMMNAENYQGILNAVNDSYSKQTKAVQDGEAQINAIIQKAANEHRSISASEQSQIDTIKSNMKTTGIKYLSESETESNLILQRLKDNSSKLTAEQAIEVGKNAKKARDDTVKSAKEQYDGIALEAQRMLDTGSINKTQYDEIISAAAKSRDDTISAANTQYDTIKNTAQTKLGDTAALVDTNSWTMKSNWDIFCEGFKKSWTDMWDGIVNKLNSAWASITTWWGQDVAPKFTKAYWTKLLNNINSAVSDWWNDFKNHLPKIDFQVSYTTKNLNAAQKAIIKTLNLQGWPQLSFFANGGFPSEGQMFIAREAGAEMVGSMNGHTAVANNDQIVAGIEAGVYRAVSLAMGNKNSNGAVKVYCVLDGKLVGQSVADWNNGFVNQGKSAPIRGS